MSRDQTFRIAVRKFPAFEHAIAAQWNDFEAAARTGLQLDAVALDLHPLEEALLPSGGMLRGDWDVCFVATDWLATIHAAGAAVDLAPHLGNLLSAGEWPESLLRLQRIEGAILGTPYHDGPECLMFRRDLFEDPAQQQRFAAQHGRPLAPPATWNDFHQVARFFHQPSRHLFGTVFAGFPDGHNTVYDFLLQLWSRGGELIDAEGNVRFNTEPAHAALTFLRMLWQDASAMHPGSAQYDSVAAGMAFARGEAAMAVNWFGFAAMAHTSPGSAVRGLVDIAEIPAEQGFAHASLNVYWVLALAAGSPHKQVAARFLEHCLSPAMDKLTTTSGAIGCRRSTWHDPEVTAAIPFYPGMDLLHRSAREIPRRSDWPRIAAMIDHLMQQTASGSTSIAALLEQADHALERSRP